MTSDLSAQKQGKQPFRKKLWRSFILVALVSAFLPLSMLLKQPWDHLYELIHRAFTMLASVTVLIPEEDLRVMNRFSLEHLAKNPVQRSMELGAAFNMILMENRILSEAELRREVPKMDAQKILTAADYWMKAWAAQPEVFEVFKRSKRRLFDVVAQTQAAGFSVAQLYIMLDRGRQSDPFFQDRMAFVLESLDWKTGEDTFAGEAYPVSPQEQKHWRSTYLAEVGGVPGFYHNPVFDPLLPRFDTDEWGTWFTAWHAIPAVDGHYNTFNIDFDAGGVEKLMIQVSLGLLGLIGIVGGVIYLSTRFLVRSITRPVDELTSGALAVRADQFDHIVPRVGSSEFINLIEVFNSMILALKERFNLRLAFASLVSEELADLAAREGITLGGEEIECTILFTDFAGFSTITQGMPADRVVALLNEYFAALIPIIKKYKGLPDKYIGDAIVAIFGAPIHLADHAHRAVQCAIEMQQAIRRINQERLQRHATVFEMRVGLNTGPVLVGAIGCAQKMEYTSIGEVTNLANRMESACKIGHVLMAENTFQSISMSQFVDVHIDVTPLTAQVKGYKDPVRTYGVYVHNLIITKNENMENGQGFYVYTPADQREKKLLQ